MRRIMVIQAVLYTFAPEDADKVNAILLELRDASRQEDGVDVFDVVRSTEKPNEFGLWEIYRDHAAVEAHQATEHFKRLVVGGLRALAKQRTAVTGTSI
jgi:quinol monooxygenase YgiN